MSGTKYPVAQILYNGVEGGDIARDRHRPVDARRVFRCAKGHVTRATPPVRTCTNMFIIGYFRSAEEGGGEILERRQTHRCLESMIELSDDEAALVLLSGVYMAESE